MALPAPQLLLALLLLATSLLLALLLLVAASLLAEGSDTSCTGDALTVPRGQRAVMSCVMSTPLTHVAIRLSAPGEASRLIFTVDGPGHFSNKGWRLEVRNGEARLVIPDAQPAQARDYTWFLEGTHRSVRHMSLSVSELPVTEAASTPPAGPGTWPPPPASTVSPVPVLPAVIIPVLVLAVMAVLAVLAWRRRRRSQNLGRIRQMQMFPGSGSSPEPQAEQGRLVPGMQPEEPRPLQSPRHHHQTLDASPTPRTPAPDAPTSPPAPGAARRRPCQRPRRRRRTLVALTSELWS